MAKLETLPGGDQQDGLLYDRQHGLLEVEEQLQVEDVQLYELSMFKAMEKDIGDIAPGPGRGQQRRRLLGGRRWSLSQWWRSGGSGERRPVIYVVEEDLDGRESKKRGRKMGGV